jgi:hypothetical protein
MALPYLEAMWACVASEPKNGLYSWPPGEEAAAPPPRAEPLSATQARLADAACRAAARGDAAAAFSALRRAAFCGDPARLLGAAATPCVAAVEAAARVTAGLRLSSDNDDGIWARLVALARERLEVHLSLRDDDQPSRDAADASAGEALLLTCGNATPRDSRWLVIISLADLGELDDYRRVPQLVDDEGCDDHCALTMYIRAARPQVLAVLLDDCPPD